MIRQATLTSKQHDLRYVINSFRSIIILLISVRIIQIAWNNFNGRFSRCILSREFKLRELYRATGIYEGITKGRNKDIQDAVKIWSDGESLFLEENNVAE